MTEFFGGTDSFENIFGKSIFLVMESLEQVLESCHWNMALAARRLGVNRSTVLRRMRKAGLRAPG